MGPEEATNWVDAARVSLVGFAGVFLVLALLYAITTLYGALAQWMARRADKGTSST